MATLITFGEVSALGYTIIGSVNTKEYVNKSDFYGTKKIEPIPTTTKFSNYATREYIEADSMNVVAQQERFTITVTSIMQVGYFYLFKKGLLRPPSSTTGLVQLTLATSRGSTVELDIPTVVNDGTTPALVGVGTEVLLKQYDAFGRRWRDITEFTIANGITVNI